MIKRHSREKRRIAFFASFLHNKNRESDKGAIVLNKERMLKQYEELKTSYKVDHLLNENKKVVFVLESPHIDEVLNEAPVSGLSGKAMSKVIFGDSEKIPMGIKTKKDPESPIGIMNICPIPMQRAAYLDEKVESMYGRFENEVYKEFFDVLEKLRVGTKEHYKDQKRNDLQEIVLNDFKHELRAMKDKEIIIIPCGKTAETFFAAANIYSEKWTVLTGVPHPSFGNWHKVKYAGKINEMKASF